MEGVGKIFCVIAKYLLEAVVQDTCMMLPLGSLLHSETHGIDISSSIKYSESLDTLSKTSKSIFESLHNDFKAATTVHPTLKEDPSINKSNSSTFDPLTSLSNEAITKAVQHMNSDGIFFNPLVANGRSQLLLRDSLAQSRCSTTEKKVSTSLCVATANSSRKFNFLEFTHVNLQYRDYMNVIGIHINRRKCFLPLRKYIVRVGNKHNRSDVIRPEEVLCLELSSSSLLSPKENELNRNCFCGSIWTTIASKMAHRTLSTIIKTLCPRCRRTHHEKER